LKASLTQRLYASWLRQNGYSGPRHRPVWGVGGVAPDVSEAKLHAGIPTTIDAGDAVMCLRPVARPEKPDVAVEHQLAQNTLKSC